MDFDEARKTILNILIEKGRAKNRTMIEMIGGDHDLFEQVREDLIFEDLADDKKNVGLIYIGTKRGLATGAAKSEFPNDLQEDAISLPSQNKSFDVFISYSNRDYKTARTIVSTLEAVGI